MAQPIASLFVDLRAGVGQFTKDLNQATRELGKIERKFKAIGKDLTFHLTAPLAGLATISVKTFADFEKELVKVQKKSGATAKELDGIKQAAIDLAKVSPFATRDVTEGMKELAAAGFDANKIIAGMPGVLGLASVAEIGVADAAKTATDVMGSFQLGVEDLENIIDKLAVTSDVSKVDISDLAETITYAGSTAHIAGRSFEEIAAAAGVLGDAGIRGSLAGTGLSTGILRLLKPTKEVTGALKELGLSINDLTNADGTIKPLVEIIQKLSDAQIKAGQISAIFGKPATKVWASLVNSGVPALEKFAESMINAGGYTKEFQAALRDTTSGRIEEFGGALSSLATTIGEVLAPKVKLVINILIDFVDRIESAIRSVATFSPLITDLVIYVGAFTAALGPLLYALGSFIAVLKLSALGAVTLAGQLGIIIWSLSTIINVAREASVSLAQMQETAAKDTWGKSVANAKRFVAELNAANKSMEDHNKELGAAIQATKNQIKALEEQMWKTSEKGAKPLEIQINALKDKLKIYEDALKTSQPKTVAIGKAMEGVAEKTKKIKDPLDKLRKALNVLTGSTGVDKFKDQLEDLTRQKKKGIITSKQYADAILEIALKSKFTADEIDLLIQRLQGLDQEIRKAQSGTDRLFGQDTILGKEIGKTAIGKRINELFSSLGGEAGEVIATSLGNAFEQGIELISKGGSWKPLIQQLGGDIGSALGASIGGPVGASIGSAVGKIYGEAITNIGKSSEKTASGLTTIMTGGLSKVLGVSDLVGGLFKNKKSPGTIARNKIQDWINKTLADAGKKIRIFDSEGNLHEIDKFILKSGSRFNNPNWTKGFDSLDEKAKTTFTGLGEALQNYLGIEEKVGKQVGIMLAEQLFGNVDNARLLVQQLGIGLEDMQNALVSAGLKGQMSWHEVEVALQGVNEAYGVGLSAVGDYTSAFEYLLKSGGKGIEAIKALKDTAVESMEAGATTLQELENQLRASGRFTEQEITVLFQALSQRGITSLEQLANVSDRVGGGIIADMQSLGVQWKVVQEDIQNVKKALDQIPKDISKNLTFNIQTKIDKTTGDAMNAGVFSSGGSNSSVGGIPAFARGGIIGSPTFFNNGRGVGLAGEAGAEAILPLKRIGGRLGVAAQIGGQGGGVTYNIDARGASTGVEKDIMRALKQVEDNAVNRATRAIAETSARGGYGGGF